MRKQTHLLVIGLVLVMAQPTLAQSGGGQQEGGQGAGGAGAGAGAGMGAGGGFGTGGSAEDVITDSDAVFGVERNNAVGVTSSDIQGFSAVGEAAGGAPGMGRGGMGGIFGGGLGGFGGMFGGGGAFGPGQQQEPETRIRTRLRADIRTPAQPAPQVEARIQSRWSRIAAEPRFRNVNIEMRGRTAILNGQVDSGEDHRMAELLLRLEPGVSQIENRLLIAGEVVPVPAPPANEMLE